MQPTPEERDRRRQVMESILAAVRSDQIIKLPPFDPARSRPSDQSALQSVGVEPNAYGGTVADYRYQFEGEEDLLHLIVTRRDDQPLTVEDGQTVTGFLLNGVPPAMIWLKPGDWTQHFYVGHDELLTNLKLD